MSKPLSREKANLLIDRNTVVVEDQSLCRKPVVSVSLVTFNHIRYFRDAIEGALRQETDFDYEIVIGDDFSTDGTTALALQYQQRYPDKIRLLASTQRLGALTGSGRYNHIRNFRACRGKFIAMLEGDDFWTRPDKLQQQVDYLDADPAAAGCFHLSETVDADTRPLENFFFRKYKSKYSQAECLTRLYSSYATCSLMFRQACVANGPPDYYYWAGSDHLLDLAITETGSLDFIPIEGAAYRIHPAGIWQGNSRSNNCRSVVSRFVALSKNDQMNSRYEWTILERIDFHLREYDRMLREENFSTLDRFRRIVIPDHVLDVGRRWRIFRADQPVARRSAA